MTKKLKKLFRVEHSMQTHMVGDGFKVSQLMPGYGRNMTPETSPFLMLDYNKPLEIKGSMTHRGGVGFHPHRGFETVTIAYSGEVEHHDTEGNHGVITPGEVQWMTAGSGLFHQEYISEKISKSGGMLHFVQLWIDLPKEYKMCEPKYQALTNDIVPEIPFENGKVRIFAGNYNGNKGAATTFSPIELYDVRFEKAGNFEFSVPDRQNTMILVIEGEANINGRDYQHGNLAYFGLDGTDFEVIAKTDSTKILVMSGTPLNQNVVNYGSFVMTSPEEIMQAFKDMNAGKM